MAIEDNRLAMLEQRVAMLEHRLSLQSAPAAIQEPWSPPLSPIRRNPKEGVALIQPEFEEDFDESDEEQTPEPEPEDEGYDPELDKKAHPVLSDFKNPLPKSKAQSATHSARIVLGGGNGLGGSRAELETLNNELWDEALDDE